MIQCNFCLMMLLMSMWLDWRMILLLDKYEGIIIDIFFLSLSRRHAVPSRGLGTFYERVRAMIADAADYVLLNFDFVGNYFLLHETRRDASDGILNWQRLQSLQLGEDQLWDDDAIKNVETIIRSLSQDDYQLPFHVRYLCCSYMPGRAIYPGN